MTVFVVNMLKGDTDLSKAAAFGDIKYVNIGYVYGDQLEHSPIGDVIPLAALDNLVKCAQEFDPERDFLLIAGDHLQLVALAALLGAMARARLTIAFKVLRWDRQADGYFPVTIQI